MAAGSWQGCQSLGVSSSWDGSKWDKKCKEVEHGINDFTRVERSEGMLDVKIGGTFEPIHQGSTWREDEEKMTSVVPWLGNLSVRIWERDGSRRVCCDGRLGVRRFDHIFSTSQDGPCQDRQGNWRQIWPWYVKANGQKVCAITDNLAEEDFRLKKVA